MKMLTSGLTDTGLLGIIAQMYELADTQNCLFEESNWRRRNSESSLLKFCIVQWPETSSCRGSEHCSLSSYKRFPEKQSNAGFHCSNQELKAAVVAVGG
ncbi:hypothetical protein CIB84_017290 [Bambusicola thoracicus]|uniref:Uncharacterized protein n=1 Tax=Bambusicola thoracicus TaxID=9083 RepID=A0A2P4S4C9_BAMTH|nr:hypothetical protein CIB84_017290 [Bambusicola thoracicus]